MSHANAHCTYFVVVNPERCTLTRYVHHRGTWGVRHLRTVVVEPPEAMSQLGTEAALDILQQFRKTGDVA